MSDKEALLKKLDDGFAAFKQTISGLTPEQQSQAFLGDWNLKELLAHVSGWHREMSVALERMARGERPTPEGVDYSDSDAWNAKFSAGKKDAPFDAVVRELEASFGAFRSAVAALPEDRFEPGRTVDRIVHTTGINHYLEHGGQIEEWRKSA
jgi:hypothetical protein